MTLTRDTPLTNGATIGRVLDQYRRERDEARAAYEAHLAKSGGSISRRGPGSGGAHAHRYEVAVARLQAVVNLLTLLGMDEEELFA